MKTFNHWSMLACIFANYATGFILLRLRDWPWAAATLTCAVLCSAALLWITRDPKPAKKE